MNTKQVKKIAMYRAVDALLANAPETRSLASLAAARPLFVAKLDEVDALIAMQERPLGATLAERNQALQEVVEAALTLGGIALSYADQRRLEALAIRVRVTEGDFNRARLDQRVRMAQQIYDAVLPLVAQLADFGVTAATLDDLQTKIDVATAALPASRGTSVDKKAATAQLATAVRAVDAMLENQIDPLMLPLRRGNPQFYERYQVAREVVGRPGGRDSAPAQPENASPALVMASEASATEKVAA